MKYFMSMVFAFILMMSNIAKANTNQDTRNEANFEFTLSMREMNRNLRLDINQFEILSQTSHSLSRRIERLSTIAPEKHYELLSLFIADNLSTVRNYLSNEQYDNYRSLLNEKLQQHGLDTLLKSQDAAMNTQK